jgi:hypothetical protein
VNSERRDVTFLVRTWRTQEPDGVAQWRGCVQEVTSGKRMFFADTRDVADFIASYLAGSEVRKV